MSRPLASGPGLLSAALGAPSTEPKGLRRRALFPGALALPAPAAYGSVSLRSAPTDRAGVERPPTLLVVAERVGVRNAVAKELARDFELLHAISFTSAVRKLSARPSLAAVVVDLDMADGRGAPWFLARLVDHAYEGPRILLSGALAREDASSMRRGSVSHFTLATPWRQGELRASIELALSCAAQESLASTEP